MATVKQEEELKPELAVSVWLKDQNPNEAPAYQGFTPGGGVGVLNHGGIPTIILWLDKEMRSVLTVAYTEVKAVLSRPLDEQSA
ncbi:hypothetical protein EKL29_21290 [Pantoea sp. YU22]|uniref:hypothetical protein n=1 Tax=Pantoea sp. YU22 TaxID=2497684 RepID=UPI000F861104|nr:hypothetical protein [Pantoea sp. YU22]RTY53655.1 hypothetical protein EKL29_21290 [Pantoea sp. YU22]